MTAIAVFERQADFETAGHGLLEASTTRRPDAVSLDYLTAWSLGPAAVADLSEGRESRLWRARILEQGEVLLVRSTVTRDAWIDEEEAAILVYPAELPVEELTLGFTAAGDWVVVAQRATGTGGDPEIWIASSNPYYQDADA